MFLHPDEGPPETHCLACRPALARKPEEAVQTEWHYIENRKKVGPVTLARLLELIKAGSLRPADMVLLGGTTKWTPLGDLPELLAAAQVGSAPVPVVESPPASPSEVSEWYYRDDNNEKVGPVGFARLREFVVSGWMRRTFMLQPKGTEKWVPAMSVAGLFSSESPPHAPLPPPAPLVAAIPKPVPAAVAPPPATEPPKPVPVPVSLPTPVAAPAPVVEPVTPPPPPVVPVPGVEQPPPAPPKIEPTAPPPSAVLAPAVTIQPERPIIAESPRETEPAPVVPAETPPPPPALAPVAVAPPESLPAASALPPEPPTTKPRSPERVDAVVQNPPATVTVQTEPAAVSPVRIAEPELTPEEIVSRFKSAWWQGRHPDLEDYLPRQTEARRAVVAEMARIDLQGRLNWKDPVKVESYLELYPELAENRPAVLALVELEYTHRRRRGDVSVEEFVKRFPQLADELPARLESRVSPAMEAPSPAATRPEAIESKTVATTAVEDPWLASRLDGKPQPIRPSVELVEKLAEALHDAHGRGVVFGNLSPACVIVASNGSPAEGSGSPKLSPFDPLKKPAPPVYVAPEQFRGQTSTQGDIYALGVILYEMLTGRPPFNGESPRELAEQVQKHEPAPPSQLRPQVPADLDIICLRCLEKTPHDRYATAGDLAHDLRSVRAGQPVQPWAVGLYRRAVKLVQRYPAIAGYLAAALVLAVLLFAGIIGKSRDAIRQIERAENAATRAEQRTAEATHQNETATKTREKAEREAAASRVSEVNALRELIRMRDTEKAARENELKALEREKIARDDEKKARGEAARLSAELDQSNLAWHRQLAEQWEKAGQWTAAAFHLGRLIENSPKDEKLVIRRADAYRQGGEHLLAVADYSRAMQLKPGLALNDARDLCLRRSLPAQASGTVGLAATGVLGGPSGLHLLLATPVR
ncbi:hypothetical protein AYO44_12515 [Planctomycetaceae bacterium SCGC AG-212-F19]|nr:hypothetical protein AYO44_12515 [Planctomycetaceae bacterium SCGC AG-212-F19]